MKVVFDAGILIDFLNGNHDADKVVTNTEEGCISIITYIEVLAGIKDIVLRNKTKEFLSQFTLLELDRDTAEEVIKLRDLIKLNLPNALILATAIVNDAILLTRDESFKPHPNAYFPYSI